MASFENFFFLAISYASKSSLLVKGSKSLNIWVSTRQKKAPRQKEEVNDVHLETALIVLSQACLHVDQHYLPCALLGLSQQYEKCKPKEDDIILIYFWATTHRQNDFRMNDFESIN